MRKRVSLSELGEVLEIVPLDLADVDIMQAHVDHPEERIDRDEGQHDDGGHHEPEVIGLGCGGVDRRRLGRHMRDRPRFDAVRNLPDAEQLGAACKALAPRHRRHRSWCWNWTWFPPRTASHSGTGGLSAAGSLAVVAKAQPAPFSSSSWVWIDFAASSGDCSFDRHFCTSAARIE